MIEFFVQCVPPTANHQRKRIVRIGNFTKLADKPELVAAKSMLDSALYPHQPATPIAGAVRMHVEFTWPWRKSETKKRRALGRVHHTTKPDSSNAIKTLEDRLTALSFITDDKAVADLRVLKFWGDTPGIYVRIESLD